MLRLKSEEDLACFLESFPSLGTIQYIYRDNHGIFLFGPNFFLPLDPGNGQLYWLDLYHSGAGDLHYSDWTELRPIAPDRFNVSSILGSSNTTTPKYCTAGIFHNGSVEVTEVQCDAQLQAICQIDCQDVGNNKHLLICCGCCRNDSWGKKP